ncbi:hypothetical protein ACHAQH_005090 [Verticillium albo-atrum]
MDLKPIESTGPRSFIFYVIADAGLQGPSDGHRPLAVTYRQGHGHSAGRTWSDRRDRVNEVIDDCVSILTVLTEPANRVILEAELALAVAWYQSGQQSAEFERNEIPDVPQPRFEWASHLGKTTERPELPWASGTREFPFISSCLRLALNRQGGTSYYKTRRRLGDVQEQPLGTLFHGNKLEYGMVVIDVTNLDNVSYGIVGPQINYLIEAVRLLRGRVEAKKTGKELDIRLEESRSRRPLSGSAYMRKYHLYDKTDAIGRLTKHPVSNMNSMNYIWPRSAENPSASRGKGQAPKKPKGKGRRHNLSAADYEPSENDLLEEAVIRLVQDGAADKAEREILERHRTTMEHRSFQAKLRSRLLSDPSLVHHSSFVSSTQLLLRLAYAGNPHLNWVAYKNLTYEDIAAAIRSPELHASARALSICIDERGFDSDAPLFDVLAQSGNIRDVCFFQGPERASDDESSRLFSRICESPLASRLLGGSKNIHLTCAFSAPLRRKTWLQQDLRGSKPVLAAFPVQHMFVRRQVINLGLIPDVQKMAPENVLFQPCHFFLGDALLKPERLVAGFTKYCRAVLTDRFLLSFAAPPSYDLNDDAQLTPGVTTGPISAEILAVPERCSISPSHHVATPVVEGEAGREAETHVECWPLFQNIEPNGWVLLVSHEWHTTPKTRSGRKQVLERGTPRILSIGVPFVRYALVRTLKRLEWPLPKGTGEDVDLGTLVHRISGYIEVVGGVRAFLRETAPAADVDLAERRLDESARVLRERWPEALWAEGARWRYHVAFQ